MTNFSKRLIELRKLNGYSQLTISESTKISIRYYQDLEYSKKEPTLSKLIALADFFNVSLDYLVGRSDNLN